SATRLDVLPGIPTVGDFVSGYEATGWQGVGAPRSTPAAVIEKLNREINAVLADPKMKARIVDFGYTVFASSPANFGTPNSISSLPETLLARADEVLE